VLRLDAVGRGLLLEGAEVVVGLSDGALDLCMAEQELDGPKVAGAPIDQRRLRPPEGMRAEKLRIKSDAGDPFRDKPRVLACRHAAALLAAPPQSLPAAPRLR
jgi:hypothetical protein